MSLFSGYSQKENRTTNYCLLVLKLIYEENPKYLGEVLSSLVDEQLGEIVGVRFRQQEKKLKTVPDGLIWQQAFTVFIETKNYDWFHHKQLEKHLVALDAEQPGVKVLLALSNFDSSLESRFETVQRLCEEEYSGRIYFSAVSFEEFLGALPKDSVSKNLADTLSEFESYLDEQGLLPRWQRRLDVVNCRRSWRHVVEHGLYLCPAQGGSYSHSRCKYFGVYFNKAVTHIGLIEAVIDLESEETAQLLWNNVGGKDKDHIAAARERQALRGTPQYPRRAFLLSDLTPTEYRKTSKGGMLSSKRYFDVESLNPEGPADLAEKLREETWE